MKDIWILEMMKKKEELQLNLQESVFIMKPNLKQVQNKVMLSILLIHQDTSIFHLKWQLLWELLTEPWLWLIALKVFAFKLKLS